MKNVFSALRIIKRNNLRHYTEEEKKKKRNYMRNYFQLESVGNKDASSRTYNYISDDEILKNIDDYATCIFSFMLKSKKGSDERIKKIVSDLERYDREVREIHQKYKGKEK